MRETYGKSLPGMQLGDLAGKLIVIEGTDGAGRSTQINLLKPWLEEMGHAVLDTGMTRSSLAGEGIKRAKEGNNLGRVTQSLFYATDLIDRLENEIAPALRAGFVVLTDRYIYSLMARAMVRGVDPTWVRRVYSVALKPDAVLYLRLGVEQLIPRVAYSRGFDYWESGMDFYPAQDMFEAFCNYQRALLAQFERLGAEYRFEMIDASQDAKAVFEQLKPRVLRVLEGRVGIAERMALAEHMEDGEGIHAEADVPEGRPAENRAARGPHIVSIRDVAERNLSIFVPSSDDDEAISPEDAAMRAEAAAFLAELEAEFGSRSNVEPDLEIGLELSLQAAMLDAGAGEPSPFEIALREALREPDTESAGVLSEALASASRHA